MDNLKIQPHSLVFFIDETGSEDYNDPAFPVFGYGGCAVMGVRYKQDLEKPWHRLKRERLGGAKKPFHTSEFQRSRPTMRQIGGINCFVKNPFYRFASITRIDTKRPLDMDGHKAVSHALALRIKNIANRSDAASIDLVFEDTERNKELLERDFDPNYLDSLNFKSKKGQRIDFNCYFLPKSSNAAGLEVADLIVHTAGRQERLRLSPTEKEYEFQLDFIKVFHGVDRDLIEYISVDEIK